MNDFTNLHYAYGKPQTRGEMKQLPEDFTVHESLGFTLTGEGEHQFLYIEKNQANTEEVAKELAHLFAKPLRAVSYAGLKDKHAVTRQWFSIHCPGEKRDDALHLSGANWHVVDAKRHNRKLRTGALAGNQFYLRVKNINYQDEVEEKLVRIKTTGVPNYFGSQRFGNGGNNLLKAEQLLMGGRQVKNSFLRGMYYSAARAFLFNKILSLRVFHNNWNKALPGDVFQLAGTQSIFTVDALPDDTIANRIRTFDIAPTAVLWGQGEMRQQDEAANLQMNALTPYENWCHALENHKLVLAYRPLIMAVHQLEWQWQDNNLLLQFYLRRGCYATSLLRELILFDNNASVLDEAVDE